MAEPDYTFTIKYPLFSKARPRLTRKGTAFMPPEYKKHQRALKTHLLANWQQAPLEGPVGLRLFVSGEARGDADNIAGAFMDAAVGIVFIDDRINIITSLCIHWKKEKKQNSEWICQIYLPKEVEQS